MCLQNHIVSKLSRGAAERGEATHHLWYLQVSAALTSSVTAPASLISSMITTRGCSPPLSLSIWLARSERYNCNSWKRKKKSEWKLDETWSSRTTTYSVRKVVPFGTGDASWRWRQSCDSGRAARGQPLCRLCCAPVGNGPDGEPGGSFPSRWVQTEPGVCASAASWCSAASLALESSSRTPASRRTSPWCLGREDAFDC